MSANYLSISSENEPANSTKSICIAATILLMGTAGVALATHGTSTAHFSAPAVRSSIQPSVTTLQRSVAVERQMRPSLFVQSHIAGNDVDLGAPTSFTDEQTTANPSTLHAASFAMLTLAVAGAVLSWWRTPKVGQLQPAFMQFGYQEEVAMFYSTGHRTSGRKPMEVYNLMDRMSRLVRSNVTALVQSLEDPEKVIEQAVVDMQSDLVKIRQSYSEVLATQKRTEVKQKQVLENMEAWQKRAELALVKGDEELAREALRRKNIEQKALEGINAQLNQGGPIAENLLNSMKLLEQKLDEAKATKAQLIARAKSAESTKKVNDMLTGLDTGSALAAFDRMEEKVQQLEASAEVSGVLAEGSTIDKRFQALEGSSAVEDELAALKRQLEGPKEPVYLPPSRSEEDIELEKIRKALRGM